MREQKEDGMFRRGARTVTQLVVVEKFVNSVWWCCGGEHSTQHSNKKYRERRGMYTAITQLCSAVGVLIYECSCVVLYVC